MPSMRLMPSDSSLAMDNSSELGVGLTVGMGGGERGELLARGLDREQAIEPGERRAEPARRVQLRDQAAVGDRRGVADAEPAGGGGGRGGERGEPALDERPDPRADVAAERLDRVGRR